MVRRPFPWLLLPAVGLATALGIALGLSWAPERMRLVGKKEITRMLDLSPDRVDQLTHTDGFPVPIDTLAMGRVWDRSQVVRWAIRDRRHRYNKRGPLWLAYRDAIGRWADKG
jgi:hypothetical protein